MSIWRCSWIPKEIPMIGLKRHGGPNRKSRLLRSPTLPNHQFFHHLQFSTSVSRNTLRCGMALCPTPYAYAYAVRGVAHHPKNPKESRATFWSSLSANLFDRVLYHRTFFSLSFCKSCLLTTARFFALYKPLNSTDKIVFLLYPYSFQIDCEKDFVFSPTILSTFIVAF